MTPLDWTLEDSKKAAQIHVALSKAGETLGVKDILIAAPCIVRSIPIVSRNILHFKRIPDLDLIDGARFA
jgi:predicted nucleic acid-binding protein